MTVLSMPSPRPSSTPPRLCFLGGVRTNTSPITVPLRARKVLAVLAMQPGRLVQFHVLIRELYGEDPPVTAKGQVYVCVSQLRRKVSHLAITSITRANTTTGYILEMQDADVDVLRFKQLAEKVTREMRAGRYEAAEATLDEALSLHHGEIFEDIEPGRVLTGWAELVHDLLRTARLRKFKFAMRRGWHEDILDELRALWRQDMLHADIASLLMLALYRSNQPGEALRVYDDTRRILASELGIDPTPQLQDMLQGIVSCDRSLLVYEND